MLDLTFAPDSNSAPDERELAPARALLTPTWVAALALLVANDHWLKGAGLIPEVLTGKLSDFAGMLVAPVLLASLLRVRSRRGLALCHAAIAVVFAGIQLAPAFAAQWSALMGLFGHPWAITCDPTDLIALPFLGLSWALLVPAMDPSRPALVPIQRTAVAGLSVFGLWSTVATSDDNGIDFNNEWYVDVYGHVYVNNANDLEVSLYIRELRDDLRIDCDEVSLDPGRLLTADAFGEAEHWLLPAWTNVAIEFDNPGDCSAALVAGEGIPPVIVFLDRQQYAPQWFAGQDFEGQGLDPRAGLAVTFGDSSGNTSAEWSGADAIRFKPKTTAPELPPECELPAAESRIDWPAYVPNRDVRILEVSAGVDGCFELMIEEVRLYAGEIEQLGAAYPFYLCAPAATVPFLPGEFVSMDRVYGEAGDRQLNVTLLDGSLDVALSDAGVPMRKARYIRGSSSAQALGAAIGATVVGVPSFSCPWLIEDGCATVERPTDIGVSDAGFLVVGEPLVTDDESLGIQRTLVLARARERAIVDQSCSDGALELDYDIDMAVVDEPLI